MFNPIRIIYTREGNMEPIILATQLMRSILQNQEMINYQEFWNRVSSAYPDVKDHYYISSAGRVYNIKRNAFMTYSESDGGYLRITVRTKDSKAKIFLTHRAVLLAFDYNPDHEILESNHVDGNKSNNSIFNLQWTTRKENAEHAAKTGLYLKGESQPGSIYNEHIIRRICHGLSEGWKAEYIARYAGLDYTDSVRVTIGQIKRGISWKHISKDYEFKDRSDYNILNDTQIHTACVLINSGVKDTIEILRCLGISYASLSYDARSKYVNCISDIRNGKRYKHIVREYDFYKNLQI